MKKNGQEPGEDDRVSALKRLSEGELVTYVNRVLHRQGSIDPGTGLPAALESDPSRVNPPPR